MQPVFFFNCEVLGLDTFDRRAGQYHLRYGPEDYALLGVVL